MTELTGEGAQSLRQRRDRGVRRSERAFGPRSVAASPYTGFGTAWFDFDNDGWLDILTVNGAIAGHRGAARANDPFPLRPAEAVVPQSRQRAVRGRHRAGRRGVPVVGGRPRRGVRRHRQRRRHRRAGRQRYAGRVRLLINNVRQPQPLGGVEARRGADAARHARRAGRDRAERRVDALAPGAGRRQLCSANDPRVLVGLGDSAEAPRVRVRWPGGRVEEWPDVAIDRCTTLKEGGGR